MAEPKDFNIANPPKSVTDPRNSPAGAYPKHLYKFVSKKTAKSLEVAFDDDDPIHNEIVTAIDADAEAVAIEKGYSAAPVLKALKK